MRDEIRGSPDPFSAMDRKTGIVTGVIFLAGLLYRAGSPDLGSKAQSGPSAADTSLTGAMPVTTSETSAAEGPWTAVCSYFGFDDRASAAESEKAEIASGEHAYRSAESQFCVDRKRSAAFHRAVLIATVPDPELTHLSLTFDRYIESIMWAVADGDLANERYSFDGYWFPWRPDLKEDVDPEKRKRAEKEREKRVNTPGLLLFRGRGDPHKLLLVFLVGETPTSGINRVAFQKAWDYAMALSNQKLPICPSKSCMAILGPSFTGSMPSLKLLLESEPATPDDIFVISGSVTGAPRDPLRLSSTHFCTTIERGDNARAAFRSYLESRSPFSGDISNQLAYLVEDETAYGEALDTTNTSLVLRYPRGIARVRNSSEAVPGLTGSATQNPAYPELPLNLRDTGQDSIPSFSQQQTPVSQEAVLIELASALRREHIRYLGIIATDPLDALFLSRAARALAPNLRIVLFHVDVLFARAAQVWGLRGILGVTSYPLISRNQYYAGARPPRRTQFASDNAEGEYNACRRMLLPQSTTRPTSPQYPDPLCNSAMQQKPGHEVDYLLDYAIPFSDDPVHSVHKPPVWLTMLGNNNWWPVAALPAGASSTVLNGPNPATHAKERFYVEPAPHLWFVFFWTVWSACTAHVVLVFLMNINFRKSSVLWKYARLRAFGWGFKPDLAIRRRAILAAASLTVAAVCFSLAVAAYSSGVAAEAGDIELAAALLIAGAAIEEALWAAWSTKLMRYVAVAALLELTALVLVLTVRGAGHAFEFAGYRAIHLESGISPLLPLLLLLWGVYLFFWFRLSQLRTAEDRGTTLANVKELRLSADLRSIERNAPKLGVLKFTAAAAGLVCWLLFFNPFHALATVEGGLYDIFVTILSSVLVAFLGLTVVRFLTSWGVMRKLLQSLERHPNRYAFSRLPREFSWTAVWSGDPRPKLWLPMRSLDVLRMIPEGKPLVKTVEEQLAFLNNPDRPFSSTYVHVQRLRQRA